MLHIVAFAFSVLFADSIEATSTYIDYAAKTANFIFAVLDGKRTKVLPLAQGHCLASDDMLLPFASASN